MHIDKNYIVIGVALAVALTAGAASAVYQFPTLDGVTAQPTDVIELGRPWDTDILLDIPGAPSVLSLG